MAVALAKAIQAMHGQHLVHRDIKPASVLVDASSGQLRLMNFGITSELLQERLDPTEVIAGTLPYMAPDRPAA